MKKSMQRVTLLILFLALILNAISACITAFASSTDDSVRLLAEAGVLMDGESGRVLYGKNQDQKLPMASTTKIMTCILALENAKLDEKVTISKYATGMPEVRLGVREKERYYLEDLLYSLMLESHNDSAVAIAEHVGKTTENFAGMMNKKAKEIGCKNTHFITPNGLDAEDKNGIHCTTAGDLAAILRYCIVSSPKHQEFIRICKTKEKSISSLPTQEKTNTRRFSLQNHNALLDMYDGAIAGKTGFTGKAGYCYVGAVKENGKLLIVSLLACGWPSHKNYKWVDTRNLLNYAKKYSTVHIQKIKPSINSDILVKGSMEEWKGEKHTLKTVIRSPSEKDVKILKKQTERLQIVVEQPKELNAPIQKGDTIGKVKAFLNHQIIFQWEIQSDETIKKLCFTDVLGQILQKVNLKNNLIF